MPVYLKQKCKPINVSAGPSKGLKQERRTVNGSNTDIVLSPQVLITKTSTTYASTVSFDMTAKTTV